MNHELIAKTIRELLGVMGIAYDNIEILAEEPVRFVVKTGEAGVLIGPRGTTYAAFSHLVRKIAGKRLGEEEGRFVVDVNDYHANLVEAIRKKVSILSERARTFKTDVELEPMSPYERLIVHTICQGSRGIKTESKGEGKGRRVVIRYIETEENTAGV